MFQLHAPASAAAMLEIGDHVIHNGTAYRLVGVTPANVTPFRMQLEDLATGELFWVEGEPREDAGTEQTGADATNPEPSE
jgi:hypothetical protein